MNIHLYSHSLLKCAALISAVGLAVLAHASEQPSKTQPTMPKSVFVDDAKSGKDPFFPNSTRRVEELPHVTQTSVVPVSNAVFSQLALKGISGTRGEPLALINTTTVGLGETAEIRCSGQIVKVVCREIRESSVLIELVGSHEVRELRLRDNI
jgi:hypothetical protein